MLILWYADFDGTSETLESVSTLLEEVTTPFDIPVEGPYFPQHDALLYIFRVKTFEQFNEAGRIFLTQVNEKAINIVPVRYELAVTPDEFWGT